MPCLSAPIQLSLLIGLAPFSLAAQDAEASLIPEEKAYVDPYVGLTAPHGAIDDAVPLPKGAVVHEPAGAIGEVIPMAPPVAIDPGEFEETLHFVRHGEEVWMRGPAYKACVSKSGFTYIPFLGAKAPRNYPVTFQLESATLGGEALGLDPEAQVTWEGQRFVLDRGPVDVIYDVEGRQVEQLFALDLAGQGIPGVAGEPGVAGDLVLDVRVTSGLTGHPRGTGFRFDGPDGGMDYGAATVLDGAGRSAAIETVLDGDVLRLTVPGAFLAMAEGDVVIDPILTTYVVDETGGDQREVDAAYDQTTDTFTFVYEDTFSGNDADIYRRTRTRAGVLINGGLVFGNDQVWRDPAIANLNSEDMHLFVASVATPSGDREVRGRTYRIAINSQGPVLVIGGTEGQGFDNLRPDVSGNASTQPGKRFLVVWERSISSTRRNVRIRAVEADGTLGTVFSLDDGDNVFHEEVSISQSAGDPQTVNVWNIVWRSQDLTTDTDSLYGAQITTNVFLASPSTELVQLAPGRRLREVDVSDGLALGGPGALYIATYDDYGSAQEEVAIVAIRDNVFEQEFSLAELEHADRFSRVDARVGATDNRFIVTYVKQSTSDVFATVLQLIGQSQFGVAERRALLGSTLGANRGGAAIATVAAGGEAGAEAGIGWSFVEPSGDYGANGVTFSSLTPQVAGYNFCFGRANSTGDYGFLSMLGAPTIADTKIVTASGLPPNQFAILLVGTLPVNIPMIGGSEGTLCLGGQFGRYNNQISSSGSGGSASFLMDPGAIPAPFGIDAALVGEQFFWQAWHRDVVGGAATSNLTNAVGVTFE